MLKTKKVLREKLEDIENLIRNEEANKTPSVHIVEKIKKILVDDYQSNN